MPSKCRKIRASFWKCERSQLLVGTVQGMRDRVRQRLFREIALQLEDIVSTRLDFPVLGFREAPDQDVNLAFIVGKVRRHLLAKDHSGQVRDLQTPGDGIVIGDRHELHADFTKPLVQAAADPNSSPEIQVDEAPSPQRERCGGNEYEGRLSTSKGSSFGTQAREPIRHR